MIEINYGVFHILNQRWIICFVWKLVNISLCDLFASHFNQFELVFFCFVAVPASWEGRDRWCSHFIWLREEIRCKLDLLNPNTFERKRCLSIFLKSSGITAPLVNSFLEKKPFSLKKSVIPAPPFPTLFEKWGSICPSFLFLAASLSLFSPISWRLYLHPLLSYGGCTSPLLYYLSSLIFPPTYLLRLRHPAFLRHLPWWLPQSSKVFEIFPLSRQFYVQAWMLGSLF